MISHKHKFIFIHIPKCGGSSVEQAMLNHEGIDEERILAWDFTSEERQKYRVYYKYGGIDVQHKKIDQYKDENEKKYFTFTFVRNPWERFLSEYFYIRKQHGCGCDEKEFNLKYSTFRDFVVEGGASCCWYAHNFPQIDFVFNANQNKLTNFVGRCEDMQTDFDYVCKKIGISKIELPYRNPTKHKHYTEYYNDETREIVAERYAKDIEYFGYEYGK
jgi:hypothetical protein